MAPLPLTKFTSSQSLGCPPNLGLCAGAESWQLEDAREAGDELAAPIVWPPLTQPHAVKAEPTPDGQGNPIPISLGQQDQVRAVPRALLRSETEPRPLQGCQDSAAVVIQTLQGARLGSRAPYMCSMPAGAAPACDVFQSPRSSR